jgi:hypothetical protein
MRAHREDPDGLSLIHEQLRKLTGINDERTTDGTSDRLGRDRPSAPSPLGTACREILSAAPTRERASARA